jgi:predicted RNA-binding protein with TRAM domain
VYGFDNAVENLASASAAVELGAIHEVKLCTLGEAGSGDRSFLRLLPSHSRFYVFVP